MSSDDERAPAGERPANPPEEELPAAQPGGRPILERLGLAAIAVVLGGLFAVVAVAGYLGGEPFMAGMGAIGALMTLWVGALTLFRG